MSLGRVDSGISIAVCAPNGKQIVEPPQGGSQAKEVSSASSTGQKRAQAAPPDSDKQREKRARTPTIPTDVFFLRLTRNDAPSSQPQEASASTRAVTISSQPRPEPLPRQKTRNSRKLSGMVPADPTSIPYSNYGEGDLEMRRIIEGEGGEDIKDEAKAEEASEEEREACDSPSEENRPTSIRVTSSSVTASHWAETQADTVDLTQFRKADLRNAPGSLIESINASFDQGGSEELTEIHKLPPAKRRKLLPPKTIGAIPAKGCAHSDSEDEGGRTERDSTDHIKCEVATALEGDEEHDELQGDEDESVAPAQRTAQHSVSDEMGDDKNYTLNAAGLTPQNTPSQNGEEESFPPIPRTIIPNAAFHVGPSGIAPMGESSDSYSLAYRVPIAYTSSEINFKLQPDSTCAGPPRRVHLRGQSGWKALKSSNSPGDGVCTN
ncbi:hypothetical protein B0H17DRAFT_1126204 [Mycena rosella]|uniref:Uncharacterized protein n=1 Tax=Mycena rosella TaxID=1033263 RepID=A0AAD7GU85_MYCRO|nr:hypothetical protein B0H17DRAFT_1126204 [Mycena rosella]